MTSSTDIHEPSCELCVLEGEQQGARIALHDGKTVSVSGDWDSDVVLRGTGTPERRLSLTVAGDRLRLAVLAGEVQVGGQLVTAGDMRDVPLRTPMQLGSAHIAVRPLGADAIPDETEPPDEPTARPPVPDSGASAPLLRPGGDLKTWSRRLAAAGAALAAVSVGVLAFAYTAAPLPPTPQQRAQRAEATLHAAGLQRLSVRAAPSGALQVVGHLDTAAERAHAERLLLESGLDARLAVWVNEQVALAVQDVYRANGIAAKVETTGPGAVRVNTRTADPSLLDSIAAMARRDVAGLTSLDTRNTLPPPASSATAAAIDDAGKRVASIVPGDSAYVVTADGTRYFVGALLPTGHRITSIGPREVLLERDGRSTPLTF